MRFAVILPTYNRPNELKACLQSLLDMSYPNWVAMVVNDGSAQPYDGLEPYLADERIHYLPQAQNQGVNQSRNIALQALAPLAVDWVTLIDDDDAFCSDAFDRAMAEMQANPTADWLLCKSQLGPDLYTPIGKFGWANYIDDYLYGPHIKRDATHFMRYSKIHQCRFSRYARNGEEWTFFCQVHKQIGQMWVYDHLAQRKEYLEGGLTKGGLHKGVAFKPYYFKFIRPMIALRLSPGNPRALKAMAIQLVKFPLRFITVPLKWLSYQLKKAKAQ